MDFNFYNLFEESGLGLIYLYSSPFFALLIFAEMLFSHFGKKNLYTKNDIFVNVTFAVFNFALDFIMKSFAFGVMFFFFQHRIFSWNTHIWYYWAAVFLLQDFAYYLLHVVDHKSRFFWSVHITHHSSEYYNISTGFRSPVFQPLYRYLYFSPLAFLGFNPWHIMGAYALFQVYGTLVHTLSIKSMGILEWVLVTPSHHRVHHARNIKYLDKNMGMALIIWDRIFGTFQKEEPEIPVKFGIYPKPKSDGAFELLFYEWKKMWQDIKQPNIGWQNRLKYMFYAPGWKPNGQGKTVKDYQREYELKQINMPKQP